MLNQMMMVNTLVAAAYLVRGALVWVVARATVSMFLVLGGGSGMAIPFGMSVLLVVAVVVLGWIDIRRQHERILLANLGVRPLIVSVLLAAPAIVGESLLYTAATILT